MTPDPKIQEGRANDPMVRLRETQRAYEEWRTRNVIQTLRALADAIEAEYVQVESEELAVEPKYFDGSYRVAFKQTHRFN